MYILYLNNEEVSIPFFRAVRELNNYSFILENTKTEEDYNYYKELYEKAKIEVSQQKENITNEIHRQLKIIFPQIEHFNNLWWKIQNITNQGFYVKWE